MDLKQKYREETNLEPYGDIDQKDNYTRQYVKWLEKQCNLYSVVVPKGTLCDVCGSDDIIEAPHMGKNCNRCHPL